MVPVGGLSSHKIVLIEYYFCYVHIIYVIIIIVI